MSRFRSNPILSAAALAACLAATAPAGAEPGTVVFFKANHRLSKGPSFTSVPVGAVPAEVRPHCPIAPMPQCHLGPGPGARIYHGLAQGR